MREKPVAWLGSSLEDLRAFPEDARRAAGYQLGRVQQGLMPSDWRPMTTVGPGVIEIRVQRVPSIAFSSSRSSRKRFTSSMRSRSEAVRRRNARSNWLRKRLADLIRRRAKKPEAR